MGDWGDTVQDQEAPMVPPEQELALPEAQWRYMMLRRMMASERRDRAIEKKLNQILAILTVGRAGVAFMRFVLWAGGALAAWWALFPHGKP